ncbi:MAG: transglycosylase domain-containing protein, partial [bacterium]
VGLFAASYYYFDKEPQYLTLPEAALLAGTLNSPAVYDPYRNLEAATRRRNIVLRLMRNHGYISDEVCEATSAIPVENTLKYNPVKTTNAYASYVDRVTKEVKNRTGFDPNSVNMTIYTYMDKDIQSLLDDISTGKVYTFTDADMQAGSVVQEAHTGRIIGIMAAKDYIHGNYDFANEKHQPGSSIKPILDYGTAFEYLYWSNVHSISDAKITIGKWTPKNFDNKTHGTVSLDEALGRSYNLAAIRTLQTVMENKSTTDMINWLKNLGYDMDKENFGMPYAIGAWSYGTTCTQQAAAYAAIANGGLYIEPHTIEKIVINTTQKTIYVDDNIQSASRQAMSSSTAFLLREVMTSYVKKYSNYSGVDIGDEIGAKTGTSNHDGSISGIPSGKDKDHWFCCYSPDYAWATWNGYPGNIQKEKKKYQVSGQNDSRSISTLIAKKLHEKGLKNSYETPSTVVHERMIKGSYPYASPSRYTSSSRIVSGWFVKGHGPSTISGVSDKVTDDLKLNAFTASYNDGHISVSFQASNPTEIASQYHVEIYQGTQMISQESFSQASATLSFTPETGTSYRLVGYVKADDMTSNKISTTITAGSKTSVGSATYSVTDGSVSLNNGDSTTSTSITVDTSGPSENSVTINVNGTTRTIHCGSKTTFSLDPGTYTISCVEMDSSGYTAQMGSTKITIVEKQDEQDED